jgi:hypothetical protein
VLYTISGRDNTNTQVALLASIKKSNLLSKSNNSAETVFLSLSSSAVRLCANTFIGQKRSLRIYVIRCFSMSMGWCQSYQGVVMEAVVIHSAENRVMIRCDENATRTRCELQKSNKNRNRRGGY